MKKKRGVQTFLLVLLFVIGLGILLYPTIADWWNQKRSGQLIQQYSNAVSQAEPEDFSDMLARAEAYNRRLVGTVVPDAFADRHDQRDPEYESLLNPSDNGLMCTVEIPVIGVYVPVYHYTTEEVLQKGAGHLPGSSLPIGGPGTHSVISAHRGLPSAKLFTDLNLVKKGDVFYLHVLNETLAYEVDFINVVVPSDTEDLAIVPGEDHSTLFTCTPYAINTHRLLVRGRRIPYTVEQYQEESHRKVAVNTNDLLIRVLCVAAGLLIAFVIILILSRREKRRNRRANGAEGSMGHGKKEE